MSDVSVSLEELKKQFSAMSKESSELEAVRKKLLSQYQQLGSGWKDAKYKQLGAIVTECNNALRSIEKTLLEGQKSMLSIIAAVQEYESTNISGSGSGTGSGGSSYEYHFSGYETHEFPDVENPRVLRPDHGAPPVYDEE